MTKPMTRATFRRLWATADTPAARDAQGIAEAYGMGALAGLLFVRLIQRKTR